MSGEPDPKTGKRIESPELVRAFLISHRVCAACGAAASNAHHVLQKGSPHFGDDLWGNLLPICGTGTWRCHGAFHGTPYEVTTTSADDLPSSEVVVRAGALMHRRDQAWVARRLGEHIWYWRPDVVAYLTEKLGRDPALAYLERAYLLNLTVC